MEVSISLLFWLLLIRRIWTNSMIFIKHVWLHTIATMKQIGIRELKVPLKQPIKILKIMLKEMLSSTKNLSPGELHTKRPSSCLEQFQAALQVSAWPIPKAMNYGELPPLEITPMTTWEFWETRVSLVNHLITILLPTIKINNCILNLKLITIL